MKSKGKLFIFMGLLLIAASLLLIAYNLYDEYRAGQFSKMAITDLEEFMQTQSSKDNDEPIGTIPDEMEIPDYILNPDMDMPEKTIDGVEYIGILSIPTLGLELPVISQWSYPNLKNAPCRYSGSVYKNNMIIAAHNYGSHFGNLKNLKAGDIVTFTDIDGNVFTYEMAELEILQPTAIEHMESGEWDLTLFTCTIGGQSRVTVRFVLKN